MGKYRDELTEIFRFASNPTKDSIARGLIVRLSEAEAEEFIDEYGLRTEEE